MMVIQISLCRNSEKILEANQPASRNPAIAGKMRGVVCRS
jgi:hypothetical protein